MSKTQELVEGFMGRGAGKTLATASAVQAVSKRLVDLAKEMEKLDSKIEKAPTMAASHSDRATRLSKQSAARGLVSDLRAQLDELDRML